MEDVVEDEDEYEEGKGEGRTDEKLISCILEVID